MQWVLLWGGANSSLYIHARFVTEDGHSRMGRLTRWQASNWFGVPTYLVTQNSMYFPHYFQVKAMESKVNLASNQCLCWSCRYDREVNQNYFCKWYLEKWSLKHRICQFQAFSRFGVKIPGFTTLWANSRQMKKFQVFQVGWEPCDCAL